MPSDLDIHPASSDELVAAHQNVFDIWSKGLPLDEHVRYRLTSPSHSRASWFVGTIHDRVVVSLGAYPVRFHVRGQDVMGMAIGSVYTLSSFRGHGYAPRLIGWVEEYARERRTGLSVLYSDIGADYYARLGYVLCPSPEGWLDPQTMAARSADRLAEFSPGDELPRLKQMYAAYHGGLPLSFARDDDYWASILKKNADDKFYALADSGGGWAGYVRIGRKAGTWRITDYALADRSEALADRLYAALGDLARSREVTRLGGWLPQSPSAQKIFPLTPRKTEITMIKPLAYTGALDAELIERTSHFCEIDHV